MKTLISFVFVLTIPLSASAQQAIYLSGLLGIGHVSVSNSPFNLDPDLSFGARAGVLFTEHVAVGAYWHQSNNDIRYSTGQTFKATNLMAEISYFFNEADENGFWLSGLLGTTQASSSLSSASETDLALGFSVGYQFALTPNFTLSPQLVYIHTDGSGDPFNQYKALMNLTAWF
jgi:hypothetical protein